MPARDMPGPASTNRLTGPERPGGSSGRDRPGRTSTSPRTDGGGVRAEHVVAGDVALREVEIGRLSLPRRERLTDGADVGRHGGALIRRHRDPDGEHGE